MSLTIIYSYYSLILTHFLHKIMPKIIPNNNRQIVVSNQINEARFKMSRAEQRLFLYCIGIIDNDNDRLNLTFKLKIEEFKQFLELKRNDFHTEMREITKTLAGRVIEIKNGDRLRQMPVLSLVDYNLGEVTIKVNSELAPFLIELKNNFTKFSLKEVLRFKSLFSMRIYQFLSQYAYKNEVIYTLEELRYMLDIAAHEYRLYGDFKRYVIDKALKEINSNSSLKFTYKEIKTGRKITAIHFIIKKLEPVKEVKIFQEIKNTEEYKALPDQSKPHIIVNNEPEPTPQPLPPVFSKLTALGFSSINATKLITDNTPAYLEFVFERSKIETRDNVTNKAGYFGSLVEDYKQIYELEQEMLKKEAERAKEYELNRERHEQEKKEAVAKFKAEQPNISRSKLEEEPEYFCKLAYLYMKRMIVDTKSGFTYHPEWVKNQVSQSYDLNTKIARQIHTEFLSCKDLREFRNLVKYEHDWIFQAVFNDRKELNPESQEYYKKDFFVNKMELPFKV